MHVSIDLDNFFFPVKVFLEIFISDKLRTLSMDYLNFKNPLSFIPFDLYSVFLSHTINS